MAGMTINCFRCFFNVYIAALRKKMYHYGIICIDEVMTMKFFTNPRNLSKLGKYGSKLGEYGLKYLGASAIGATVNGLAWGGRHAALNHSSERIVEATKDGAFVGGFLVTFPWSVAKAFITTSDEERRSGPRR
jgi:hypothetical protein